MPVYALAYSNEVKYEPRSNPKGLGRGFVSCLNEIFFERLPRVHQNRFLLAKKGYPFGYPFFASARRGSNPRPPPWQGGAPPLSHSRMF